MDIDKSHLPFFSKRLNKSLNIGNEGAGKVIETGKDSKHLLAKLFQFQVEVVILA